MNILLQNKKTLSYVKDPSKWTMQLEKALSFGTGIEALFYCLNRQLKNMQILGEFVNPRFNFTISDGSQGRLIFGSLSSCHAC
jgi:hypothetical protein